MKKLFTAIKTESLSSWITDKYIYVMLFIFPLFTGFKGYSQITLSKYIFFVLFTSLWLIVLLIEKIRSKQIMHPKRPDLISIFILLYLFFCCLSAALSSYKSLVFFGEGRFDGLVTILLCACILLGTSTFGHFKPSYVYAVAASSIINCLIAILQIMGYNPLYLFPGDYTYYDAGIKFSSVFLGTIGNADLFSAFICIALPMISVYYIAAEKRRYFLLPAVILSAFCLISSGVSGGILAFAVFTVVSAPFVITSSERLRRTLEISTLLSISFLFAVSLNIAKTAENTHFVFYSLKSYVFAAISVFFMLTRIITAKSRFKSKSLKVFFSMLSIAGTALGIAIVYYWKGNEGTIHEISQVLHGNIQDSFGSSRILIWRETLKLVPEKLMLGGGPGTLPERLDLSFSRFVEETGKTLESYVDNAHNDYLGILVNTGLLSLISYIAAQFLSLFKTAKFSRLSEFSACLACSLLCYWIQAFFGLGLFLVSPMMWLIWGLLVSSLQHKKENTDNIKPAADF